MIMDVTFTYYPRAGEPLRVSVFDCSQELYANLKSGYGNTGAGDGPGLSEYALLCKPDGQHYGSYVFPATRVHHVQISAP